MEVALFNVFVFICALIPVVQSFMFVTNKTPGSCLRVSFMCPPAYIVKTAYGCTCDFSKVFDPSHPEKQSGNNQTPKPSKGNTNTQNSNTGLNGYNNGCNNNWLNCRSPCSAATNPSTGCVYCSCPTQTTITPSIMVSSSSSLTTKVTLPTTLSPSTSVMPVSSSQRTSVATSNSHSTLPAGSVSNAATTAMPLPTTTKRVCSKTIDCILNCAHGYTLSGQKDPNGCPVCTCNSGTTQPLTTIAFTTSAQPTYSSVPGSSSVKPKSTSKIVLPIHYTTPHSTSSQGSTQPTTTLKKIVCPGVFNCSKVCYTGYKLNAMGCPLCECAQLPTNLPCKNPFYISPFEITT